MSQSEGGLGAAAIRNRLAPIAKGIRIVGVPHVGNASAGKLDQIQITRSLAVVGNQSVDE